MPEGTVIEVDGCKITPEFIKLLKSTLTENMWNGAEFKKSLFDVQTALLYASAADDFRPDNLRDMAQALSDIYNFVEGLLEWKEAGKF